MRPIIRVENLGKEYHIGGRGPAYATLRETLVDLVTLRRKRPANDTLWALEDVSFDVMPGEVIGIIGRNGAGKSTLLKILSRITEPTRGEVDLYGRVGSLLEVGTGFHPELTGRENIFLNGAILGMKRAQMAQQFDEIVAFAEVGRMIDTPVKHYSSGMQMRLAFAVAAHLQPEILIIDEVLAVGDSEFQKKCLGKMESIAHGGRTVLFVSHNLSVVTQLCSRGILLDKGRVAAMGRADEVVAEYMRGLNLDNEVRFEPRKDVAASFVRLCVRDQAGNKVTRLRHSEPFTSEIEFHVREPISADKLSWTLWRADGVEVVGSDERDSSQALPAVRQPGRHVATVSFPGGLLNEGTYHFKVLLSGGRGICDQREGTHFDVYDDTNYGKLNSGGNRRGVILQRLEWKERAIDGE